MINKDAWISSLPNNNIKNEGSNNQLNNEKWIKTIPKVNKQNSIKKYSLIIVLFVSGLLFVSIVKNESRNLSFLDGGSILEDKIEVGQLDILFNKITT